MNKYLTLSKLQIIEFQLNMMSIYISMYVFMHEYVYDVYVLAYINIEILLC